MALREPRPTKFEIKWHRGLGSSEWYATMGGVRIAEAANTSATGTDDYPWDWYLTDAGMGLARRGRTSGVADTLKAVKETLDGYFRPKAAGHLHDTDSAETGWCSGCGRTDLAVQRSGA